MDKKAASPSHIKRTETLKKQIQDRNSQERQRDFQEFTKILGGETSPIVSPHSTNK